MAIKPYRFEVAEARSFKHPIFQTITKHTFLVPAAGLPRGIPEKANLREATGMSRSVYRDVKESLRGREALAGSFDLLNLGITIIAEDVVAVDKRVFDVLIDDEYGIANGGHTANLIWQCQDDSTIAEGQFVEVRIITGVDGEKYHTLRVDIARAQNTGIAVKQQSILELDRAFDSIKNVISETSWCGEVAFKESDSKSIDVRELIAAMELMNVVDFPVRGGTHPISAYEKWSLPLKRFGDDFEKHRDDPQNRVYAKFEPLLPEILALYDIIRRDFLRVYDTVVSKHGAKLKIVETAPSKESFKFVYAGLDDHNRRLTKGAAYPILGAFRNYIELNPDTGKAQWIGGFEKVKSVWNQVAPQLVKETKDAIDQVGNAPDQLGKDRQHWANLFKTVKLHHMEERLAGFED
jgi:hypothetical protein